MSSPFTLSPALTRRALFAGLGAAAACVALPVRVHAAAPRVLTAEPGTARLLGPDLPATDILTYGGALPPPVLRSKIGEEVAIAFANRLDQPTTLSWGGLAVPNALVGVPGVAGAAVAAGQSAEIRFSPREAGTFLFGPFDAAQAARGLAGMLVVEEAAPPRVERDLGLVVQDWRIGAEQRVHLTTNGEMAPRLSVRAGERVRLRFANATRGLFLPLKLDDHPAWIIAIDGRPAEPFMPSEGRLLLAPGGRIDLLVDLTRPPGSQLPIAIETENGDMPLATLVYGAEAPLRSTALPPPASLPGGDRPVPLENATRIDLEFGDTPAQSFGPVPLFSVASGTTVVTTITNRSDAAASVHLYGHAARLLDKLDDGWKPWWHDTVGVAPGRTLRLAFVAGEIGRWPLVARRGGDDLPLALGWFEVTSAQPSTPKDSKSRP